MRIAIVSDTHLPRGLRRLPQACIERLKTADLIIHAGDLSVLSVLRELESYAQVIAVHGNVDDYEVRQALPATTRVEADGKTIAIRTCPSIKRPKTAFRSSTRAVRRSGEGRPTTRWALPMRRTGISPSS